MLLFIPTIIMNKILPFICFFIEFRIENLQKKEKSRKKAMDSNLLLLYKFFLDAKQTLAHLDNKQKTMRFSIKK